MTLTRPAYAATVANLDNVWSESVTAGDSYDPDAGVWLADGLELSWRFAGPPPAQLEPEVAKFAILADTIENLPTFQEGDRVTVTLERPTAGTPIPYMEFAGRVTDLDLVTDAAQDRVLLEVTAVDPTSELTHDVTSAVGVTLVSGVVIDAIRRYSIGGVYAAPAGGPYWPNQYAVTTANAEAAGSLIAKALAGGLDSSLVFPVLRYVADSITDPAYDHQNPLDGGAPVWDYYAAEWDPRVVGTLPALFTYAFSAADADRVDATPAATTPDPDSAITVLDACHMPDGADWRKDRTAAPNQVIVNGLNAADGSAAAPATRSNASAIARYGAITRTVETLAPASWAGESTMSVQGARYLAHMPSASALAWLFQSTELLTEVMDDATLDAYAPLFWTVREPVPGVMGTLMVLAGVDPAVDPTDGYLLAHLAGATFEAKDGHLHITPDLVPAALPALTDGQSASPTYDAFGASAFGGAKYHDQGGTADYIAPGLTYEKAKFTSL